jgi:hypothetical protein
MLKLMDFTSFTLIFPPTVTLLEQVIAYNYQTFYAPMGRKYSSIQERKMVQFLQENLLEHSAYGIRLKRKCQILHKFHCREIFFLKATKHFHFPEKFRSYTYLIKQNKKLLEANSSAKTCQSIM